MKTPSAATLHHQIDEWLALAEADALAPAEREALDLHLAACPACRRIATEHHAMSTLLKTTLETHRPDAALEDRLLSRFREEAEEIESEEVTPPSRPWTLSWLAVGIGRAFALPAFRYGGALAGIAALVVTGAMLTHEPFPGTKRTENGGSFRSRTAYSTPSDVGDLPNLDAAPATPAPASAQAQGNVFQNTPTFTGTAMSRMENPVSSKGGSFSDSSSVRFSDIGAIAAAAPMAAKEPAPASDELKKIVRRGMVEMIVPAFDKAVAGIASAAAEAGGFIDTQSQVRGPNGKLSGTLVVKVAPEKLDAFLTQTALLGEVKNRNVGAEDISKAYADTTARLANARVMEGRLVKMLAEKDGKVSDLLQVERELGRVRADIETMEAEIRLSDAQVRYATVTFQLRERDLSQSQADRAVLSLSLLAPGGDVPVALGRLQTALTAAAPDVQILNIHLEKQGSDATPAPTSEAVLAFRVPSEQAEAAEAVVRAVGPVAAFTRNDSGTDAKAPVRFEVRLLPEAEPIQRTGLKIEVRADAVEEQAASLRSHAADFGATVKGSNFIRANDGTAVAGLRLRLPLDNYPALLERLRHEGKVTDFTEERHDAPEGISSRTVEIDLTLWSAGKLVPDENGPLALFRRTVGEGAAALGWSARMIGVALAFLAPWLAALALAGGVAWFVRRGRKK